MTEARVTRTSIINMHARQIFDSCGVPTIEVDLQTELGLFRASVPCGRQPQTSKYEAKELRDAYEAYNGLSVEKAIKNIHDFLVPGLKGMDPSHQQTIDVKMAQDLDGSQTDEAGWTKKRLGANAIYAVSVAVCQAGAAASGIPIWQHIANLASNRTIILPVPHVHIFDGGKKAENGCLYQEFSILPTGAVSYTEGLKFIAETFSKLKEMIETKYGTDALRINMETGGFAPNFKDDTEALEFLVDAIQAANLTGKIQIGIDVAAYEFYDKETKLYDLGYKELDNDGTKKISGIALSKKYTELCTRFPIISIEDPFDKDDWVNFGKMTDSVGESIQIIGDETFQTNPIRLEKGMRDNSLNGILLKPNQVGTVWEAIEVSKTASKGQWGVCASTRVGETDSTFLSDMCVGLSNGQIKSSSFIKMDGMAKLNHLLRIEEELGDEARYAGSNFRQPKSMKK